MAAVVGDPGRHRPASRGLWQRGAAIGLRLVNMIIGPIGAAIILLGLSMTAAGLGAGGGWSVPLIVPLGIGLYAG